MQAQAIQNAHSRAADIFEDLFDVPLSTLVNVDREIEIFKEAIAATTVLKTAEELFNVYLIINNKTYKRRKKCQFCVLYFMFQEIKRI